MAPCSPKRRKLDPHENEPLEKQLQSLDADNEDDIGQLYKHKMVSRMSTRNNSNVGSGRSRGPDATEPYSGDMYKSSLFNLQVDEMLLEVRPNYSKLMGPIDNALHKLKTLINSIEDRDPLTVSEASKLLHKTYKIAIPFPDPKPNMDAAYKLAYSQPSNINVVGSYSLKTLTKRDHPLAVDMIVTLPTSILQEKDYLNYRYIYKKAYYLACLAAGLREKCGDEFEFQFEYLGENTLQPILTLKPGRIDQNDPLKLKYHIHIIPAAPEGFFNQTRLHPMKNAIRPVVGSTDKAKPLIPTPFYNASLRADSNFTQYLKLLHLTTKQVDGFRDLCILGRIWLRQRGLGGHISSGGFGQFEWAVMTALLLQDGAPKGHHVLSPSYSTYQLFKATLQYLSTTDLVKNPVCFQAPDFSLATSDKPVFYDGLRGHNILFKMTPWSYAKLHEEAKLSIEMLNDTTFDQFNSIFITSKDNAIQEYDSLFQVPVSKPPTVKALADHRSHTSLFTFNLYAILKEGLTDRVKDIQLMVPSFSSWSLRSSAPSAPARILVGVVFDPANIDRTVDHGPPAEHKSGAAKFQKFWGDKAELRRFKDGSILESLVWSQTPDSSIFQEIITYLVKRHFDSEVGEGVEFIDHDISRLLPHLGSSPKVFSNLMAAFRTLEKDLRVLESLPLQLKLLSAVGPQLRLSSVKLPTFSPRQQLQNPVDVLVHFEGSGRWPDDIVAIQRTKMAFLLKIGALLEDSVDGLTTRFGLENTTQPLCNSAFLDVLYPSGAAFRLGIYIDREYTLLDRQLKDSTTDFHLREDLRFARSLITRKYIQLPLHAQSVQTNCTRYPLLSPTIRLVKKWFESHMLCDHISEEFIELVVLHTFLHPYPWRSPSSPMTGFLRTLHFLSRWDWRVTPLVIDFSGSMTNKDVTAMNTRLTAWRKLDPGMNRIALFAASNHDMTGTVFTDGGPSKVVAGRMTALARSACLLAKDQALSLDPRNLFKSSTSEHDFVIHISRKFTENRGLKSDAQVARFKNLELQQKQDLHLVGYEPVQLYLAELTELFTTSIVFFHDPVAARIAGLWNPQTTSRPFRINLPYGTKPTTGHVDDKDKQDVDIDKQAVLSAIARLGGDMISRIEVHH